MNVEVDVNALLAQILQDNGKAVAIMRTGMQLDKAHEMLQNCLRQVRTLLPVQQSHTKAVEVRATTLCNLGCVAKRQQDHGQALEYLQEASKAEKEAHGYVTCSTLLNHSAVLTALERFEDALEIAQQCVAHASELEPNLSVVAWHNLAVTQQCNSSLQVRQESIVSCQKALELGRMLLGDDHPTTVAVKKKLTELKRIVPTPKKKRAVKGGGKLPLLLQTPPKTAPQSARKPAAAGTPAMDRLPAFPLTPGSEGKKAAARALRSVGEEKKAPPPPLNPMRLADAAGDSPERRLPPPEVAMRGAIFTDGGARDGMGMEPFGPKPQLAPTPPTLPSVQTNRPSRRHSRSQEASASQSLEPSPAPASEQAVEDPSEKEAVAERSTDHTPSPVPAPVEETDAAAPEHVTTPASAGSVSLFPPQTAAPLRLNEAKANELADTLARRTDGTRSTTSTSLHRSSVASMLPANQLMSRYIVANEMKPVPVPISFSEVKQELTLRRKAPEIAAHISLEEGANIEQRAAEEQARQRQLTDQAVQKTKEPSLPLFQKKLKAREQGRRRQEQEEAQRREELRIKEEARQKEEERMRKQMLMHTHRKVHACRIVQRWFRGWQRAHNRVKGVDKAEDARNHIDRARVVIKYARRWLRKTEGRRLLVRILDPSSARRVDYSTLAIKVCAIQRGYRCHRARRILREQASLRIVNSVEQIFSHRNIFAAILIQSWFRRVKAVRFVRSFRDKVRTAGVLVLQRWVRKNLRRLHHLRADEWERLRGDRSAIKIQCAWRRYVARLRVAMLRLRRRINLYKNRDTNAALLLQRVLRAHHARFIAGETRSARLEELALEAAIRAEGAEQHGHDGTMPYAEQDACDVLLASPPPMRQYSDEELERRRDEVAAFNEMSRQVHLEQVVSKEAAAIRKHYTPMLSMRAVETRRAEEDIHRQKELRLLRMTRSAKLIQKQVRRFLTLLNDEKRKKLMYRRAELGKANHAAREKARQEDAHKASLRKAHDLGKDAREAKEECGEELRALKALDAPEDMVHVRRELKERTMAARELRALEDELARQIEVERESLRTVQTSQVFLTRKERQRQDLLMERSEQNRASPLRITEN